MSLLGGRGIAVEPGCISFDRSPCTCKRDFRVVFEPEPVDTYAVTVQHIANRPGIFADHRDVLQVDIAGLLDVDAFAGLCSTAFSIQIFFTHLRYAPYKYAFGSAVYELMLPEIEIPELRRGFIHGLEFHFRRFSFSPESTTGSLAMKYISAEEDGPECLSCSRCSRICFPPVRRGPGGFEAKPDIGTDEGAVTHEHVVDATAHFTHHKAAVRLDIRRSCWRITSLVGIPFRRPLFVPAALDADAVVAGIKMTILHECVLTALRSRRIGVLSVPGIFTVLGFDRYVFAELDMHWSRPVNSRKVTS